MKVISLIICAALAVLFIIATDDLPDWGDANSPANTHLSHYYLTHSLAETKTPNVVTAILADYRGFDTLLETTVVLIVGLAVLLIMQGSAQLLTEPVKKSEKICVLEDQSIVVKVTTRLLVPFAVIFSLYVLAHGHYSPGGGFQAGVILGAILILYSYAFGQQALDSFFSTKIQVVCVSAGVLIYAFTGLCGVLYQSEFLDYAVLSKLFEVSVPAARSFAILVVEAGVTLTVMSVMFMIFSNLHADKSSS